MGKAWTLLVLVLLDGGAGMPPPPPPWRPPGMRGLNGGGMWGGGSTAPGISTPDPVGTALRDGLGSEWIDRNDLLGNGLGAFLPKGSRPPTRGSEQGWKFLPPVPLDALVLAIVTLAGQESSPYLTPDFLAAAYLVEIGEPSLLAIDGWKSRTKLMKYVESCVRPLPDRPAALPSDEYGRLVVEDLAAGYAHSASRPLAPRVTADRGLTKELRPNIVEAARHPHPLVRRNAVLLLSTEDELCKLLESDDMVCRYRAVRGLLAFESAKAGAILKRQLKSRDEYWRRYCLYALAFVHPEPSLAVLDGDPEETWAALQVLARCAKFDTTELKKLEATLATAEGAPERSRQALPSSKIYRIRVLRRLAWCALARQGIKIDLPVKAEPKRRLLAEFPDTSSYLVIELISRELLRRVAEDELESSDIRCRAIALLGKDASLKSLARSTKVPYIVRVAAIGALDETEGVESAAQILEAYAEGVTPSDDPTAEFAALIACRYLASKKAIKSAMLIPAYERSIRERRERARRIADADKLPEGKYVPPRYVPFVPLAEGLLSALAPLDPGYVKAVLKSGSGEAALALGESGVPGVETALQEGLKSPDAWTRFSCAFALKRLKK